MSIQYIRYECPNCGKRTREGNTNQPRKCSLCNKIVCSHCSPTGFCEDCLPLVPEVERKALDRALKGRKIFTIFIFIYLAIFLPSIVMTIVTGTTDFQAAHPNAGTMQIVFLITALVCFFGSCVIAIVATRVTKKVMSTQENAAFAAKQQVWKANNVMQNNISVKEESLFAFVAEIDRNLGIGPKTAINEIVQNLMQLGLSHERPDFLQAVRSSTALKFARTSDQGKALISFMVIVKIVENSYQKQGMTFNTTNYLQQEIQVFLRTVMRIPEATGIASNIFLG